MGALPTAERTRQEILRLCHAGHDARTLQITVFDRLQLAVPYAAFWCGTTDPETLLFTGAVTQGLAPAGIPAFVTNELLGNGLQLNARLGKRGGLRVQQRTQLLLEVGLRLRVGLHVARAGQPQMCAPAPQVHPAELATNASAQMLADPGGDRPPAPALALRRSSSCQCRY